MRRFCRALPCLHEDSCGGNGNMCISIESCFLPARLLESFCTGLSTACLVWLKTAAEDGRRQRWIHMSCQLWTGWLVGLRWAHGGTAAAILALSPMEGERASSRLHGGLWAFFPSAGNLPAELAFLNEFPLTRKDGRKAIGIYWEAGRQS